MKIGIIVSVAVAFAVMACKPPDYNSGDVQGLDGQAKPPASCFLHSFDENLCGKDKTLVFVSTISGIDGELAQRTKADGFNICAGSAWGFIGNRWQKGVGVWMNGHGLGCYPGVYKITNGKTSGPNVVTWLKLSDLGIVLSLSHPETGLNVGTAYSQNFRRVLSSLCNDKFEKYCTLKNDNNTLRLVLNK